MKIKIFSFVFLMLAAIPVAMASHVPSVPGGSSCYDLKGSGKGVLVGGVANAGVVNFDPSAGAPEHKYEACVRNLGSDSSGPFRLEGWAWNNNLGWISFYCPPGGPGVAANLGLNCSNSSGYTAGYGVTMDANGKFGGYAWGDNAGWIRFNNPSVFSQVRIEATDPTCQGYVYGATKPKLACPAHGGVPTDGPQWTHAWSDNVGWIDFDGISMPWFTVSKKFVKGTKGTPGGSSTALSEFFKKLKDGTLDPKLVPDGVTVQVFPDDISGIKDKAKAPSADGKPQYIVRVNIFTASGEPIKEDRYTVTLEPKWTDTVKKDQTKIDDSLDCNSISVAAKCAATKNPLTKSSSFSGIYEGSVSSKAPTSSMNRSTVLSSGPKADTFSNEDLTYIKSFSKTLQPNNLKLETVKVSIKDNYAGEDVFSELVAPLKSGSGNLHFKPLSEITTLYDKSDTDIIEATINNDTDFSVQATGSGTVDFMLGLNASEVQFKFLESGATTSSSGESKLTEKPLSGFTTLTKIKARPILPLGGAEAYIKDPYLYTIVTDKETGAKYFSNKLPRVEGGLIINPVALFRGNIYTSGLTNPGKTQVLRSLGDVGTNAIRNTIFKNVKNIITGGDSGVTGPVIIKNYVDSAGFSASFGTPKQLLKKAGIPTVYYIKNGDLTLDNGTTDITWKGNRTFIVIGGNVYIKNNLYNGVTGTAKPTLGIIVLKDLSASSTEQKKQGHVYIHPDVTNIQANIFADGTVFSYDPAKVVTNKDGEPDFAPSARELLKTHQLLIEGSVASQNTVGGSLKDPPILGDGTKVAEPYSQADIDRARLYDLNYLRWYGGIIKKDSTGKPVVGRYTKSDGSPCVFGDIDDTDLPPCALTHPATGGAKSLNQTKDIGAVYIYFDPPPADLPGFGVTGALEIRQVPR